MPLITPQMAGDGDDKNAQWANKLVGKTISDTESNETCFCKTDLPEQHRVIAPGTMVTKDFRQDRLNVHVDETGIVTHVAHG